MKNQNLTYEILKKPEQAIEEYFSSTAEIFQILFPHAAHNRQQHQIAFSLLFYRIQHKRQ